MGNLNSTRKPLVSIITVTFNAKDYLEQTIQSVINQTYKHLEYIIIDGGSTDGTVDIIKKYSGHLSFWISEPDKGIYDAMNKGISHANGEIIGIVNASDFYEPYTIQTVVDASIQNTSAGIFHGNINMRNEDGTLFKIKQPNNNLQNLAKGFQLFHPTFFVRKIVYDTIGSYDTSFRMAADYDFALRCWKNNIKFFYIDRILSNFRIGGTTDKKRLQGLEESKRALLNNGISAEKAEESYTQWLHDMRKNERLRKIYDLLRKIIPQKIIYRISQYIHVRK